MLSLLTDLDKVLKANRRRRFRRQKGTIVARGDGFYLRYYTNGQGRSRVKITEKLCNRDAKRHSVDCVPVQLLRDARVAAINAEAHQESAVVHDQTVGEFWAGTYLPYIKENLRWSTSRGYQNLRAQILKAHLGEQSLTKYRTADGSWFLTSLTARLGRNSLQHVRSLASGIFTHALNLGLIDRNPWHDVKVLARVRVPQPKTAYTIAETAAILKAIERPDAKLFFALVAILALRPSEAAALRWEDIDQDAGRLSVKHQASRQESL